jgi:purine-nucleoside phosphorylase
MDYLYEQIETACAAVQARTAVQPQVGLILGSGLNGLADDVEQADSIPYQRIPGFIGTAVPGHQGELVLGTLAGQRLAVMRGRFHFYEGYSMQQVAFPVRVLHALGCSVLIVTNAAGALHADWQAGDIMRITNQIFVPGMVGMHPLRGSHDERLGARFPAMLHPFDTELADLAEYAAAAHGLTLRQGVYAMVSGPSFETAAELTMLRAWGADAVGMSTAPEVIVARQSGMRVLGLSLITNLALPDGDPSSHAEVLTAGAAARDSFAALLRGVLAKLPPLD